MSRQQIADRWTEDRLASLRARMRQQYVDALIIPRWDVHQSEYVIERDELLAWASGFSGTWGLAIVTLTRAALFVDGRYTVQAHEEVDEQAIEIRHLYDQPPHEWLVEAAGKGAVIGFDPLVVSPQLHASLKATAESCGARLSALAVNPVAEVWRGRPGAPSGRAFPVPVEQAGETSASKRRRIAEAIAARGADLLAETQSDNIAWLLNFRGQDIPDNPFLQAFALIDREGQVELFTDEEKLSPEASFELDDVEVRPKERFVARLTDRLAVGSSVIVDPKFGPSTVVLAAAAAGALAKVEPNPLTILKARKNPQELAGMASACEADAVVLARLFSWLEVEVPRAYAKREPVLEGEVEYKLNELRGDNDCYVEPSFRSISASGANGAMCHYNAPKNAGAPLGGNAIYLLDTGGQYLFGTTDTTRTTIFGEASSAQPLRQTVFISHANPEDNEFAAWLGTRLIGAGYQVWSDLLRLVGGEPFWRDIGDAIKDHAAVVVLVLSRASVTKPGVLDEIALAVATSRKLQNQRFIIPVRLDDLPFDEFPEQVIRLNAINFNGNWADGLHRLFEALDERAIEKSEGASTQGIAEFRNFRLRQSAAIADQPEQVEGNWLKILALPSQAHLCRFGAEPKTVANQLGKFGTPIVPWDRLGFGFARAAEIIEAETPDIAVEPAYDIDLQKFLQGEPSGGPELRRADARRMMVNLLRQAWEHFLLSKGMRRYEFAHGTAFYIPRGLIEKDTVAFIDRNGKARRKRLSGRSIKRNVYWSFAISIHPVVGRQWHFELKPQVVFTTDGVTPIDSKVKMARLRKSFCKNWWNDQWRALLNGFVTFLADGEDAIAVPLGGSAQLKLAASLALFEAPTTIIGDGVANLEDADSDVDSETGCDLLDDGEDAGPFDYLEDEDAA